MVQVGNWSWADRAINKPCAKAVHKATAVALVTLAEKRYVYSLALSYTAFTRWHKLNARTCMGIRAREIKKAAPSVRLHPFLFMGLSSLRENRVSFFAICDFLHMLACDDAIWLSLCFCRNTCLLPYRL